jgi:isoquinoline 1-oxidoreductase beta subunit
MSAVQGPHANPMETTLNAENPSPFEGASPVGEPQASGADAPSGITRRGLLTYALSAPVLTVAAGLALPRDAMAALPLTPPDTTDFFDLGDAITLTSLPTMPLVRLSIGTNGRVAFELPRAESGQGISTALAMMIAEELDVDVGMVDVTLSDARPELLFNQLTGGSTTIRSFAGVLPLMAAQARARLLEAAARQWGTSADSLSTSNGQVLASDGRRATYATLTLAASLIPPPLNVLPKSASQYRVIGKATRRIDALAIVTGKKNFTLDTVVPNAKPTMVRRPPTIMGTVIRVNNLSTIKGMPGVIGVCVLPSGGVITPIPPGVAVMAETFGQAWDAVNALDVTWGPGTIDGESNATINAKLKASVLPLGLPALGSITLDAEFEMAPLSHAPLESDCAIVDVKRNAQGTVVSCEIWAGMQSPIVAAKSVALDLGLPPTAVKAHVISAGGSFGRRLFWDPVQQAAQVSKALGYPCKLMYHRADDMRHGRGRPQQYHRVRATMLLGQVVAFDHRIASPRLDTRHGFGDLLTAAAATAPASVQQSIGNLAVEESLFKTMVSSPYNFGVANKLLLPAPIIMNTGSYRSVHIQPTRMVEEIMVDEMAKAMGKDPLAFRLSFLRSPRARAVLQAVCSSGQWGKSMPSGFAQGIAVHQETRSFTACLVEIDARPAMAGTGPALVTKAVIAIDVGKPINPSGIDAQVQGALAESISIVLSSGLHVQAGLPLEGSFSQYHFSRNRHYPKNVQVIVMPANGESIGGLGEVGLSASSGAIANAYARATGTKVRKFPLYFPVDFTPFPPGKLPNRLILPLPV